MRINPRECVCYGCDELDKANGPDCACEQAAPHFEPETCNVCEYSDKCHVPTHPELYPKEEPA